MNIEKLLPIAAPAPAGVVIAAQMYTEVYKALGSPVAPVFLFSASAAPFVIVSALALTGAVLGCAAMIGGEMLTYKYALTALADGEKKAAALMAFLALFCTGLVIWTIYRSDDSRPLISAVAVSVVLYIMSATRDYLLRRKQNKAQVNFATQADKGHELNMEREKTKQAAAAARLAKASAAPVSILSKLDRMDTGHTPAPRPENVEAVRVWFSNNTGSDRQAAKELKLSPSTIKACKVYLEQQNDKR